jgi:chromosome partitioning protein
MIISLLNQKGGVGKTTLSIHIATALSLLEKSVLLVDADPQGSSLDWGASREDVGLFPVIGLPKANLHKELPKHAPKYDFIIVDGPPRVNDLARSAIMASDIVLIPVQPSPYDIWAAKEIIDMLDEAKTFKENLKSAFVINRKISNTAIGRDASEALEHYELPIFKQSITQRVAFAESASMGSTVLENDNHAIASQEINALAQEIIEFTKQEEFA